MKKDQFKEVNGLQDTVLGQNLTLITVNVLPFQQQTNGVDCGVLAISFIYHIISTKTNPENITFSIPEMRVHMLHCIIIIFIMMIKIVIACFLLIGPALLNM